MKRFLTSVCVFFGIIAVSSVLISSLIFPRIKLYTKPFDGYVARCQSLTNLCDRPRLVLVGGSNLACGIDNLLLEKLLDDRYQLVNLGFHAGLGIGVHFDMIFDKLRSGDVVVLAAEYTNFGDRWSGGLPAVVFRCDVLGRNLFLSTLYDRWSSADCDLYRQYALEKFRKITGGVQLFSAPIESQADKPKIENADADIVEDSSSPTAAYVKASVWSASPYNISQRSLRRLALLANEFKDRGVTFLISASAFDERYYALHPEVDDFYKLFTKIPNLIVISSPRDYAFPLREMDNTKWHVNRIGREKRTRRLSEEILKALSIRTTCPSSKFFEAGASGGREVDPGM